MKRISNHIIINIFLYKKNLYDLDIVNHNKVYRSISNVENINNFYIHK